MRLISHICTFIVVCVDVNSCTYSDSMFAVSVASHEKHDHCARMYSEALLAREKELKSVASLGLHQVHWKGRCSLIQWRKAPIIYCTQ